HGAAVPLLTLLPETFHPRVVPISYGGLDAKAQFDFGRALKTVLVDRPERIAVIASGDLAHCLTSDAPAGFKPEGAIFDASMREAVEQASASRLLALDQDVVAASAECGYRPLLVELGILDGMRLRPEVLSYEAPFGVGYLVAQFHFA
ncbi:AmmeMemoRadiSam system protein B, partial [bacterium]|nr:AmmeMemoRadiSam system protein B [bacterium]